MVDKSSPGVLQVERMQRPSITFSESKINNKVPVIPREHENNFLVMIANGDRELLVSNNRGSAFILVGIVAVLYGLMA